MARQKARADGLIEKKRKINGKTMHFYGHSAREVDAKIKAAIEEAAIKKDTGEKFADVARAFWKDKEPKIKYGTRRGYQHKVELAVSWFGEFGMREITATDIQRELSHMEQQGASYKTVANQKSILSLIFQYWCSEMHGDANPVSLIRLQKGLPKTKRRPPTEEEVALVRQHPEGFGLCAAIMMYSGLRLGEVMALQKRDVQGGSIRVSKAVVWHANHPEIETPKTQNALRTVPILAPLEPLIKERTQKMKMDEYLFGGVAPMTKSTYQNAWLQYCASLGCVHDTGRQYKTGKKDKAGNPLYKPVMAANFTAHQLRHEFASVLVECGISENVAKDLMGHADILTTKRWYADARKQDIDKARDALNRHFQTGE